MLVPMQPTAHLTLGDGLHLVSVLVWVGSGALLLLRARPTRMTVVAGSALLANGISNPLVSATDGTSVAFLGGAGLAVALALGVLTIAILPDGAFRPPWLRWLVLGFAAWQVFAAVAGTLGTVLDVVGGVVFFAGFGAPLVAQVRNYRHESDPARRTQVRWVLYGLGVFFGVTLLVALPYFAPGWFPDLVAPGSSYDRFQTAASSLAVLALPVGRPLAMVFADLFDIDVVITRTLVYGSLTALVAGGYLLVVAVAGVAVGEAGGRLAPLVSAALVALL